MNELINGLSLLSPPLLSLLSVLVVNTFRFSGTSEGLWCPSCTEISLWLLGNSGLCMLTKPLLNDIEIISLFAVVGLQLI